MKNVQVFLIFALAVKAAKTQDVPNEQLKIVQEQLQRLAGNFNNGPGQHIENSTPGSTNSDHRSDPTTSNTQNYAHSNSNQFSSSSSFSWSSSSENGQKPVTHFESSGASDWSSASSFTNASGTYRNSSNGWQLLTSGCTNGWIDLRMSSKCIKVIPLDRANYLQAERVCYDHDPCATIVTIHSADENKRMLEVISDNLKDVTYDVWIGLVDYGGGYSWTDRSELDYTNWKRKFGQDREGRCSTLSRFSDREGEEAGKWSKVDCFDRNWVACEKYSGIQSSHSINGIESRNCNAGPVSQAIKLTEDGKDSYNIFKL